MKVSQEGFTPVTITLETQSEVDYLYSLIGACTSKTESVLGINDYAAWQLYEGLEKFSKSCKAHKIFICTREEYENGLL